MSEELHPIAVLVDELRSEDATLRLNAIHRLGTIALALGAERTREELLPFIQESLEDDDEILLALAEELGQFTEYVGGPAHAHVLLVPLEQLAAMEETLVREKATQSITKLVDQLSSQQVQTYLIPLVKRLAGAEWFSSRASATGLFAGVYPQASPADDLSRIYSHLCSDDAPMVRRAAARELTTLVPLLDGDGLQDILPAFKRLVSDDQDSVRLLAVEPLVAIGKALNDPLPLFLPTLKTLTSDKSWRVRYMVADHFAKLASVSPSSAHDLLAPFLELLKDPEAEVRTQIAAQIPGFSELLDKSVVLSHVIPAVRVLVQDQSQHVRTAVATHLPALTPILGKDSTIELLLPLFLLLLKDEFPDVRLNIISKLQVVNDVIGIDLLSKALLPAIVQLAEDKQWRVRQAIIEYIPLLATQLGLEFFDQVLSSLCMTWLVDPVFSIREAATVNLKKLTDVFGVEWAKTSILPKVLAMADNNNYLHRMTTVFAITTMTPSLDLASLKAPILPTLSELARDTIPNIRFNAAKALETVSVTLGQLGDSGVEVVKDEIMPILESLSTDGDADVRFFAEQAATSARGVVDGTLRQTDGEVVMNDV